MKRILPVLLALVAGCVSVPSPGRGGEPAFVESPGERDAKVAVREAFDRLYAAWIEGDSMASLRMMSVQGISDWILERSRDKSDAEFPRRLAAIDAARKIDLEHWIRANKPVRVPFVDDRSAILPESILNSQWLVETWKRYVEIEKASQSAIAKELEVSEIYVEGTEASVFIKSGKTPVRMYSMVHENGQWKFDYDVRPSGRRK